MFGYLVNERSFNCYLDLGYSVVSGAKFLKLKYHLLKVLLSRYGGRSVPVTSKIKITLSFDLVTADAEAQVSLIVWQPMFK